MLHIPGHGVTIPRMPSIISQIVEGAGSQIEVIVKNNHDVPLLVSGTIAEGVGGTKRIVLEINRASTFARAQAALEDFRKNPDPSGPTLVSSIDVEVRSEEPTPPGWLNALKGLKSSLENVQIVTVPAEAEPTAKAETFEVLASAGRSKKDYVPPAKRVRKSITFSETQARILMALDVLKGPHLSFSRDFRAVVFQYNEQAIASFFAARNRNDDELFPPGTWYVSRGERFERHVSALLATILFRSNGTQQYRKALKCLDSYYSRETLKKLCVYALESLQLNER